MTGRDLATGKYATRAELEAEIWRLNRETKMSSYAIGQRVGVSAQTVLRILNRSPK